MIRHRFVLSLIVLVIVLSYLPTTRAATAALAYGGLASCYQLGSTIPSFTLTANVTTAEQYRLSHTVTAQGTPDTPTIVYEGPIDPSTPRTATIQGGNAYVAGSYTLTGALYMVSTGMLVAQTSETITIAPDCAIEPSPVPSAEPTIEPDVAPADIRWLQQASPSQGVPVGEIVTVTVRGVNIGQRRGGSHAVVHYEPAALRLLDATPIRAGDWVRRRDDAAGTLTLALGSLAHNEQGGLRVRFLAMQSIPLTAIRVIRDDGQDHANPIFLSLGRLIDGPYPLTVQRSSTALKVTGRGYKPGEPISMWANTSSGKTLAIAVDAGVDYHQDGDVELQLPIPGPDIASLVVYGRSSGVVGRVMLAAGNP